jgi:hypothetical protein
MCAGCPSISLRRLEAERFQEDGWQQQDESGDSRPDLKGTGGVIPPVYPTPVIGFQSGCSY